MLAGLNFTNYDISYRLDNGAKNSSNDVITSLPTFGLSANYLISLDLSIHYKSESFFIELDDALKGALLSYELNVEYKIFQYFTMGLDLTRLSTNVTVKSDKWKGSVDDSHRGFLLYAHFIFNRYLF